MDSVGLPVDGSTLKRYPFEFSGGQQQRLALAMALACKPQVLILDEPTTGLDVTTQAVVSALVRELVDKSGTATIYVSHDLRLLRHLCDRIAVMYAGQIVELADARTIWEWPRHPYTSALLEAVPDVSGDRQVVPIPGAPPAGVVTNACSFVPRCPIALEACGTGAVVLETIDRTLVRCIRAHETDRIRAGVHSGRVLGRPASASPDPVLHLDEVTCRYGSAPTPAVDAVTLDVRGSEILGVVGESGSGKSTLLRCIIGLRGQATGRMTYRGDPLPFGLGHRSDASVRGIQMVFQNPASSLNPRQTVRTILRRPIDMFRKDDLSGTYDQELASLMDSVRLGTRFLDRYPGELSGGQQQRVALARALAASPDLVLCDEIVSSLDVSVQASILDLVHALRTERGVSFVFVTHDLGVVRSIADRNYRDATRRRRRNGGDRATIRKPAARLHHGARARVPIERRVRCGGGPRMNERSDLRAITVESSWKGLPSGFAGKPIGEVGTTGMNVLGDEWPTPCAILREREILQNVRVMAAYCDERGVMLAPHAKTSMAPQLLWQQVDAGAWALTVANVNQLRNSVGVRVPAVYRG